MGWGGDKLYVEGGGGGGGGGTLPKMVWGGWGGGGEWVGRHSSSRAVHTLISIKVK